jgi:hypothetical protein
MAQIVDGPDELLGRTLSLLGDGSTYDGTLGGENEDRAVAARAGTLLRAGRTAGVDIGGDADTCTLAYGPPAAAPRAPPGGGLLGDVCIDDAGILQYETASRPLTRILPSPMVEALLERTEPAWRQSP